jgi:hypothetical protein
MRGRSEGLAGETGHDRGVIEAESRMEVQAREGRDGIVEHARTRRGDECSSVLM